MIGTSTALAVPGLFAAFTAGLLSFLSPCVLPLIPVYLSFISGESASALKTGTVKKGMLILRTLYFIAGFTLVFVLMGIIFGGGMRFIGSSASSIITRVSGILVIILAFNTIFDFIPFLRTEMRAQAHSGKAILLGMAFAAGWTPCIGPILSSILMFAGRDGNIAHSAILLALYSLGLGIPFLLTGIFFDRSAPVLAWLKRHFLAVRIISGILLFLFGLALLTDSLSNTTQIFLKLGYALEESANTGPNWFKPIASFLTKWFTFQGL